MSPLQPKYLPFIATKASNPKDLDQALKLGLQWLSAAETPGGDGVIFLPSKDQAETSSLGDVIGSSAAKELKGGGSIELGSRRVHLATNRTYVMERDGIGPVLALWADDDSMARLHMSPEISAICLVEWLEGDAAIWKCAMRPTDVVTKTRFACPVASLDPEVEVGLREVSSSINLTMGLGHPLDRASVEKLLQRLRANGKSWTADAIRIWAYANGWRPEGAKELANLAERCS
jgi:hypothetical protein